MKETILRSSAILFDYKTKKKKKKEKTQTINLHINLQKHGLSKQKPQSDIKVTLRMVKQRFSQENRHSLYY